MCYGFTVARIGLERGDLPLQEQPLIPEIAHDIAADMVRSTLADRAEHFVAAKIPATGGTL